MRFHFTVRRATRSNAHLQCVRQAVLRTRTSPCKNCWTREAREIKRKHERGVTSDNSHLMQLSGSFLQSVLHLNLSQASHPMGGVFTRPFSRANVKSATDTSKHHIHTVCDILQKRTFLLYGSLSPCTAAEPIAFKFYDSGSIILSGLNVYREDSATTVRAGQEIWPLGAEENRHPHPARLLAD